jgi:peptide/nickel transport system substrate-binding protein
VATSLRRHLTLKGSQRKSEMGPITGVDVPDGQHVVLHYKTPFAPITAALADRAGMIMSPAALQAEGADFGDHPVCVGPSSSRSACHRPRSTWVRDPNYYAAAQVHLDAISYRTMPDAITRAANLRSGDVQLADTISRRTSTR